MLDFFTMFHGLKKNFLEVVDLCVIKIGNSQVCCQGLSGLYNWRLFISMNIVMWVTYGKNFENN